MVGPPPCVWKVLRETEGERFSPAKKFAFFQENLSSTNFENDNPTTFRKLRFLFMRSYILLS